MNHAKSYMGLSRDGHGTIDTRRTRYQPISLEGLVRPVSRVPGCSATPTSTIPESPTSNVANPAAPSLDRQICAVYSHVAYAADRFRKPLYSPKKSLFCARFDAELSRVGCPGGAS
jgi:hypothetical protein